MKRSLHILGGVILLTAVFAFPAGAQQKYTNADLDKFQLQGAYTNADLKGLPPLPVQAAPVAAYPEVDLAAMRREAEIRDLRYRDLAMERDRLQAELDYELGLLEIAYSPRGGHPQSHLWMGRLSKKKPLLEYLQRRIFLVNWEIDNLD